MSLKQTIIDDFTKALRAREEVKKLTLSGLKAEIMKVEKSEGFTGEIDDAGVNNLILSGIKKRKDSIEMFAKGSRLDLVEKETAELEILQSYLPPQMDENQLKERILVMIHHNKEITDPRKLTGEIMGRFNKFYKGQFDNKMLKKLIEEMVAQ